MMLTTAQNPTSITGLRYLFSQENGRIAAHCLELDLVASGKDMDQAEERLNAVVLAQFAICYPSGNWSQLIDSRAPVEFFERLNTAHVIGHATLKVDVPPAVLMVEKRVAAVSVVKYQAQDLAAA